MVSRSAMVRSEEHTSELQSQSNIVCRLLLEKKHHVFMIVMENHSPDQALSGEFTSSLAVKYGVADNYHAVAHPSVPNYLALTSRKTWGSADDSYRVLPREDIGSQLTKAGLPWRASM